MSNGKELGTIKIELSAEAVSVIERLLAALAANAGSITSPKSEPKSDVKAETAKTAKASKEKKETAKETKAASVVDMTEIGDDLPNADDDLFGDDAEEGQAVEYTSQDILAGFKSFAKRHDRDAARNVLKKFGYKSVQDVEPKNYTKIMQMIA